MRINSLYNEVWKKCLIIFFVVFVFVIIGGFLSVSYLDDVLIDSHVHTDSVLVSDKFISNNTYDDYIIIDSSNKTYIINNNDNSYDRKMFDNIEVGKKYDMTVREPSVDDANQLIYILQVDNAS